MLRPLLLSIPLLASGLAYGAPDALILDPGAVDAVARGQWRRQRGDGLQATAAGQRAAEAAVPGRWISLSASAEPGLSLGPADLGAADNVLSATATLQLGDGPEIRRQAWAALADATEAGAAADALAFVQQIEALYVAWAAQEAVAAHLEADVAAYRAALGPLRAGAAAGALSALDLADLEADAARLAMEALDARQQVTEARAALVSALGASVQLQPIQLHPEGAPPPNPWRPLLDRLDRHPSLQALSAQAVAFEAQAKAQAFTATQIAVGPALHVEDTGYTWAGASVQVTWPLSRPNDPAAAALRGQASAVGAQRAAARRALAAHLEGQAARYDALVAHYTALGAEHLQRLRDRVTLVERALAAGQATATRLIAARRDLHEAEHHRILVAADLYQAQALARRYGAHLGDRP